jgi:hypothetical protein
MLAIAVTVRKDMNVTPFIRVKMDVANRMVYRQRSRLVFRTCLGQISAGTSARLTGDFREFPQPLQANLGYYLD